MSSIAVASMTVTYVSSGLNITTMGTAGTLQNQAQILALNGFNLATLTDSSGVSYDVVTLNNQTVQTESPTVVVHTQYSQSEAFDEVDLTTSYTAIPDGSTLEIDCSVPAFNVSKRPVSGNDNLGLLGKNLGVFDATFTINLWLPAGCKLTSQSALNISLASIAISNGGPVKKTLLAKTLYL